MKKEDIAEIVKQKLIKLFKQHDIRVTLEYEGFYQGYESAKHSDGSHSILKHIKIPYKVAQQNFKIILIYGDGTITSTFNDVKIPLHENIQKISDVLDNTTTKQTLVELLKVLEIDESISLSIKKST